MNTISAFSSDSRELYKADIYRVLTLPENHIVHFRYKTKYVDDNLLQQSAHLEGNKVAIFFTHGNGLKPEKQTILQHFSIRFAEITKHEISEVTDVFHVYMKLSSFCNVQIDSGNSSEKKPPCKFFTTLNCTEISSNNNWQSRITAIENLFPKITFFHINEIRGRWQKKSIHYTNDKKTCYYNLTHGNRYILKISISNPHSSSTKIEISDSSNGVSINCINPFESSIQFDDHDIPIFVKTLETCKQWSLLQFKPISNEQDSKERKFGEYSTNIEVHLKLSLIKPIIFGILSTMAFWAFLLVGQSSSVAVWPPMYTLIIATILFFISTGALFYLFNKK